MKAIICGAVRSSKLEEKINKELAMYGEPKFVIPYGEAGCILFFEE